jgi:hypothetical protein
MTKTHAEILADIAAQVVAEHRKLTLTRSGSTTDPDKGNVPVPVVHDSWDYTLPERYQG